MESGWMSKAGLAAWIEKGKQFALSLPEKERKAKVRKTKTLKEYRA
jgi:hypothetical protein